MNKTINYLMLLLLIILLVIGFQKQIDLNASYLFYSNSFIYKNSFFVLLVYKSVPVITYLISLFLVSYLIHVTYKVYFKNQISYKNEIKSTFYIIICLILGQLIIVNGVLKSHYGRARPREIKEFGGTKQFESFLTYNKQCNKNCSFPSGHVAMASSLIAFAFIANQKNYYKIFALVFLYASMVSLGRIMQGGHFLSDTIAAFLITYYVSYVVYYFMYKFKRV
jgi:lipid A 4'-phosphatase